jgi:hypothetical protein
MELDAFQAPGCMQEPGHFFGLPCPEPYQVKHNLQKSDLTATTRCVDLRDWITTKSDFLFLFVQIKEKYKKRNDATGEKISNYLRLLQTPDGRKLHERYV